MGHFPFVNFNNFNFTGHFPFLTLFSLWDFFLYMTFSVLPQMSNPIKDMNFDIPIVFVD